jgi:hypothetical protein
VNINMTNISKKFVTGIATVALLANGLAPVAFAGTTIEITGNGAGSENWANVSQENTTSVQQSNTATVSNTVESTAQTGGNNANLNTGGEVTVSTGNASSQTNVSNTLNSNQAQVDCCAAGGTDVKISGNGADSKNTVKLEQESKTNVNQDNDAHITNDIESYASTGYNDAVKNVGDVMIHTGAAKTDTSVSTVANVNSARVAGGTGSNPTASFWITGNGAGSDNFIDAELERSVKLSQDNDAHITNKVEAEAKTGANDANLNTGGDVMIDTGDAEVMAEVDNSVNFNYADVNCGCTWDVTAKIAGNGADADKDPKYYGPQGNHGDNVITLELESKQLVGQDNDAHLNNKLDDLYAKTGYNDAISNTGTPESDPSVMTGDATVESGVSNSGNINVVGDMLDWEMPEMPQVDFSFNFAAMMAFFGMHI